MADAGCRDFRANAVTRRDALVAGAVGMAGVGLPGLYRARASSAILNRPIGFGRARSCILIFQWGGPSQLDTWDPKPDAPAEIRGQFSTIETRTPGLRISEYFPGLAARTDRLAIVRSMTHEDPAHLSTAHRLLTGHLAPRPNSDADTTEVPVRVETLDGYCERHGIDSIDLLKVDTQGYDLNVLKGAAGRMRVLP